MFTFVPTFGVRPRLPPADTVFMEKVLVVDDEESWRRTLAETLTQKGFDAVVANDGRAAMSALEKSPNDFGWVFTDLRMPEMGGLELIQHVASIDCRIVPVLLSGYADRSNLVAALRAGAFDFICKPYTMLELEMSLTRATERRRILLQNEEYRVHLERLVEERNAEIAGTNATLRELYTLGHRAFSIVDIEPQMNDFARYATQHFHPDTFGIFVRSDDRFTPLASFDRFARSHDDALLTSDSELTSAMAASEAQVMGEVPHNLYLQKQNRRGYWFPIRHDAFTGLIYVGYDGDRVQLLENQKYVFGLFRDRVHSFLKEHYMSQLHQKQMKQLFVSSIQAHARSIEAKDMYTAGHCDRVDRFAEILARQAKRFDEKFIFTVKVGSILHDIGKIGVSSEILCKPGSLTEEERVEIETHPAIGGRIVRTLQGLNLEPIVRHHHERFDGKGYPDRLKGEEIPIESRFILVADTYDAMTSDRPYRRAMSDQAAIEEIVRCAGSQFDPEVVRLAVEAADQLRAARIEMEKKPKGEYFKVAD